MDYQKVAKFYEEVIDEIWDGVWLKKQLSATEEDKNRYSEALTLVIDLFDKQNIRKVLTLYNYYDEDKFKYFATGIFHNIVVNLDKFFNDEANSDLWDARPNYHIYDKDIDNILLGGAIKHQDTIARACAYYNEVYARDIQINHVNNLLARLKMDTKQFRKVINEYHYVSNKEGICATLDSVTNLLNNLIIEMENVE